MVVTTKLTPSQAGSYDHSRWWTWSFEKAVGKERKLSQRQGWRKHKERDRRKGIKLRERERRGEVRKRESSKDLICSKI